METKNTFEGFPHKAQEVTAFLFSFDIFIISLRRIEVIQFKPHDAGAFRQWLEDHNIREVKINADFKIDPLKPRKKRHRRLVTLKQKIVPPPSGW